VEAGHWEVDLGDGRDLLERVQRVYLSFAGEDGPQAVAAALFWRDGRCLGTPPSFRPPASGPEVLVLVDERVSSQWGASKTAADAPGGGYRPGR
jgi:hypothetical protein